MFRVAINEIQQTGAKMGSSHNASDLPLQPSASQNDGSDILGRPTNQTARPVAGLQGDTLQGLLRGQERIENQTFLRCILAF